MIAEDHQGNRRLVDSHSVLNDALVAAASLGGPPLTLCNQSVIRKLRRRGRL